MRPVYRRIGGHAYGGVYSALSAGILTPSYDSVPENPHLPHASSLCGACLSHAGKDQHSAHGDRRVSSSTKRKEQAEALAYTVWCKLLERPWVYRLGLRLARLFMRPLAKNGWLSSLPGPGKGWTGARDFPAPSSRSFRERWRDLQ